MGTEFCDCHGVRTAYRQSGQGRDVILMHGWGQNKDMMGQVEAHLAPSFHVYNLDLPGFGESGLPPEPWGVPDYRDFLADFIALQEIRQPILIAHSFGCRIAIRYAAAYPDLVYKMCLTGAAGIRPPVSRRARLRQCGYKLGKAFLQATHQDEKLAQLQETYGSEDYRNAKGVMRPTFVKVVNDDVTPLLEQVTCPVLLVWGEYDEAVPLWMGREMEKRMPNAGLAVFTGDDHYAYWNEADRFNRVLDIFLKGDGRSV